MSEEKGVAPAEYVASSDRVMLDSTTCAQLVADVTAALKQAGSAGLSKISLSGKSFGVEEAQAFAQVLAQLPAGSLKSLDVSDVIAGRSDDVALQVWKDLLEPLSQQRLHSIDMSSNALGSRGAAVIGGAFRQQSELRHVRFNDCGIDAVAAGHIRQHIVELSTATGDDEQKDGEQKTHAPALQSFELHNNLLRCEGAVELAAMFQACPDLHTVRVTTTRVGKKGGEALLKALTQPEPQQLRLLDFRDNSFGAEAGRTLAKLLSDQRELRALYLGDTDYGVDNLVACLQALLSTSPDLEVLDLSNCDLETEHAVIVAQVACAKRNLRVLNVEMNMLGSAGLAVIAHALSTAGEEGKSGHPTLTVFRGGYNQGDNVCIPHLTRMAQRCPALGELNVNGASYARTTREALRAVIVDRVKGLSEEQSAALAHWSAASAPPGGFDPISLEEPDYGWDEIFSDVDEECEQESEAAAQAGLKALADAQAKAAQDLFGRHDVVDNLTQLVSQLSLDNKD